MNTILLCFCLLSFSVATCYSDKGKYAPISQEGSNNTKDNGDTCLMVKHGQECLAEVAKIIIPGGPRSCECDLTTVNAQAEEQNKKIENMNSVLTRLCNQDQPGRSIISAEFGWYTPGNCFQYQQTTTNHTWEESRRICHEKGGDLAATGIRNLAMRDAIAVNALLKNEKVWIGANDLEVEGTFKWIDGTIVTEENMRWKIGEPNDSYSAEDCVQIYARDHLNYSVNDRNCGDKIYALCEKPLF